MAEEVVRRSTREEALEKVVLRSVGKPHQTKIREWAQSELEVIRDGADEQLPNPNLEQEAFNAYGWPRTQENILVEEPEAFAQLVANAYRDARRYPEYTGITVEGEVRKASSGSGSTAYRFDAEIRERVGLEDPKAYKTQLSFTYQQSQNGHFDKDEETREHLETVKDLIVSLVELEKEEAIGISGNSLIIGKTNARE
jgi:hypothetical protein